MMIQSFYSVVGERKWRTMDKDKRIEELEKQNQQLTETIKQLQQKIEEQAEIIKLLNARIFGKKRKN